MKVRSSLMILMVVSALLAVGGLGYIYTFSDVFGNDVYLSPSGKGGGIQFSPQEGCEEICVDGVFMGCEKSFEDFVCGVSCKGVIDVGPRRGEMPIIGSTLCEYTECVCN